MCRGSWSCFLLIYLYLFVFIYLFKLNPYTGIRRKKFYLNILLCTVSITGGGGGGEREGGGGGGERGREKGRRERERSKECTHHQLHSIVCLLLGPAHHVLDNDLLLQ